MGRACSTNGKKRNAYRILVGKPEEATRKTQDVGGWIILKRICREIGWGGMDWIDLVQDKGQCRALVNTVMNLQVP
jgi:hypothetical protein